MGAVPFSQQTIFLVSFLGGMLMGFIWDIYRLIRRYITLNKVGTAIGDILYWILNLYLGLNIIVYISWGNIRSFILVGFLLGALLYFCLLSQIILKYLCFIADLIIKLIKYIIHVVIYPIKLLKNKLKILLIPYKIKTRNKIKSCKRRYKFFRYHLKNKIAEEKKRRKKLKKLNKLIREQRKNEKRIKSDTDRAKKRRDKRRKKAKSENNTQEEKED